MAGCKECINHGKAEWKLQPNRGEANAGQHQVPYHMALEKLRVCGSEASCKKTHT